MALQGRAQLAAVQWQMFSPENKHTSDIIHTEQLIFRNMSVQAHIHTHAVTSSERRGHEFEGEWGGEDLEGWKRNI